MIAELACGACAIAVTLGLAGCQSPPADRPPNPALRAISAPAGAAPADLDRAALARFVGVWDFEGWSSASGGERRPGTGAAAGVIEDEHFVLLDLQANTGELAGRSGRKSGSIVFASEPGMGVTLTSWGDASPSIGRFFGRCAGNESVFEFREGRKVGGRARLQVTITFETDDRWIAEIREGLGAEAPIASYTFTRAVASR